MELINKILSFIISIINFLIPAFEVSPNFVKELDKGLELFIELIEGVSFFLPLDIMILCLGVMITIDNFALASRLGQFIIKLIRG